MKSTKSSRAVVVGIFVLLGIAIFIIAVFTLGSQQKTFQKSVTVRSVFDDVQGLQKGNNVWFSGVKIGTVKKISFYKESQVEVDINIEEKATEYIRKDAKAKIGSDGLIGNKIIVIYGGTPGAGEVESGDMLAVEKAFTSDEMMNTLQANNRNLLDITGDIKGITNRLSAGEGTAGKLLTDETLANDLNAMMTTLRKTAANTERLSAVVSGYASRLNTKGSLANELVTDTVVYARLKETALQIDAASKTTADVVASLKQASNSMSAALNNPNTPVGLLLQDGETAANIKGTLRYLNAGSQKLDENMEALQHNFLLRGFFKRKAKNAPAVVDSVVVAPR